MRPKVITLCGSTRFAKEYALWNLALTLEGHIVLSCAVMGHAIGVKFTIMDKKVLDQVHIRKIASSDAIFVLNVDGYIGPSTEREIFVASCLRIPIHYLCPDDATVSRPALCTESTYARAIELLREADETTTIEI